MPERLTDARIDELLGLEAKATPGEWEQSPTVQKAGGWWGTVPENAPETVILAGDPAGSDETRYAVCCTNDDGFATQKEVHDANFIAASRNSIRSLLEEVRERRKAEKTEWRLVCIDPESTVYSRTVNSEELVDIEREKWHGTWKKQYRIAAGPWTDAEPARAEKEGKNR